MTRTVRYLSAEDVRRLMPPMPEVIDLVERTLVEHGHGRTEMPPKSDVHPRDDAFVHAMPAHVKEMGALGIKWVAGYPSNREAGLPYIHGTLILNDPASGAPTAIMDASVITAWRTGACSAVTAKHFADPNAEVMTIIGCGVQGRINIEALLSVFPHTERMLAYDPDPEVQARFADEVMTTFEVASIIPPEPREACEGAHVIVTSAPIVKHPTPVIDADWLQTGTLCVALDFDASFMPAAFERADLVITDDLTQYAYYKSRGHFAGIADPSGALGTMLAQGTAKRPEGEPIIIAVNLGLGVLDVTLGAELLRRAEAQNVGTKLPL
ncbi:MAG: ornithine cyclodeaminase family protein [Planctomycetes bacterium]|nr:ornithine cyclodeaminase family protein [Planctomycetota bacterium]